MAITVFQEPTGYYAGYNDSYLIFNSDLAGNNRAELILYPALVFPRPFLIYPDSGGVYMFNLKEAVKLILNESGFDDIQFFTDAYYKSIQNMLFSLNLDIVVYSDADSETLSKTYNFLRAYKQIGEDHFPDSQILTASENGVDHHLTYFEGFPFHFTMMKVNAGSEVVVKNLNTGNETEVMTPTLTDSFRIVIDKGAGDNWTSEGFLPLTETVNRLEIYEDGEFKSNLILTKKKKCQGIYIKWFNRNGEYNHYLFERYFTENLSASNIDLIAKNTFRNVGSITGAMKSTGKEATKTITARTKYTKNERAIFEDLLLSPFVQMYTSNLENVEGKFIDVQVEGSFTYSNKRGKNELNITIDLPEIITAKL